MTRHDETMALFGRVRRGDEAAREELIEGNMALVKSVVKRYLGRGAEYEDLLQLGSMGLIKAIDNFDLSFGVHFSTYAVPMIAGEIKRFLRDDGAVKVSRQLKEQVRHIMAAREELFASTGEEAGVAEIAAYVGLSPEEVATALEASRPVCSLNEPLSDEEDAALRGDVLKSPVSENAWIDRLLIKELLDTLDAREKQIIVLRYFRDCTQSKVAEMIGVSQVQVSRLESRILKRLREAAGLHKSAAE